MENSSSSLFGNIIIGLVAIIAIIAIALYAIRALNQQQTETDQQGINVNIPLPDGMQSSQGY